MKVILLGPSHPLRGGIANFNEALFNQYRKQGHDCSIISYSLQYPGFLFPGKTQYASGDGPEGLISTPLINSINPFSWLKVGRLVKKQRPDLLVVHFWMPFFAPALGSICRVACKNKHTKVIAICHNVKPHEPRPGDTALTSFFLRQCHGFVAMSKSTLQELPLYTRNNNAIFTPHPIYDSFGAPVSKLQARTKLGIPVEGKYLLFFGMIRKYKGLDLLLEAIAQPAVQQMGVKLLVAGEFYDKPEYYQEIIDKHKLNESVIIQNEFISNDDVRYYFCASDLVTQTYHTATQSGVSQIAYHFDIPMLVTNVGGLAEIVPHNKVGYVAERDPVEIASFIVDYFMNSRENEFVENVKQEKKRFDWSYMIKAIDSVSS